MQSMRNVVKTTGFFALIVALLIAGQAVRAEAIKKESSFYVLSVETSTQGEKKIATITVKGKGGFHCNTLYPWKLTLTPASGATVDKDVYRKADAAKFKEKMVIFTVPFSSNGGGKVTAELKLSMCNPKQCQMDKVAFSF